MPIDPVMLSGLAQISSAAIEIQYPPEAATLPIDVTSGLVGSAIITATVTLPDSTVLSDTLAVAVINSAPGVLNFTVGSPIDE